MNKEVNINVSVAEAALRSGQAVIIPTDTIYGLATLPTSKEGVEYIYNIKNRPASFNLPIMVDSIDPLYDLGLDLTPIAKALLSSPFCPGAMSLVLGFVDEPKVDWLAGRDEVAIRIPDNEWTLALLRKTGPLLVTSANRHKSNIDFGNLEEIKQDLGILPDCVADQGKLNMVPSTIVNCRYDELKVEREGVISFEDIKKWLDK
jgi:L-threonylcarbamoyladenylate synthase